LEEELGAARVEAGVADQDAVVGDLDEFVDQGGGGDVGTRRPCSAAAVSSPMNRWDVPVPVPESPRSTTGSPAST